jgi:hypothetical protein
VEAAALDNTLHGCTAPDVHGRDHCDGERNRSPNPAHAGMNVESEKKEPRPACFARQAPQACEALKVTPASVAPVSASAWSAARRTRRRGPSGRSRALQASEP